MPDDLEKPEADPPPPCRQRILGREPPLAERDRGYSPRKVAAEEAKAAAIDTVKITLVITDISW